MKVFVTKYALTKGILERDAYPHDSKQAYVWVGASLYTLGRDCFATLEEAKNDAWVRGIKKIAALKKQIERIQEKLR